MPQLTKFKKSKRNGYWFSLGFVNRCTTGCCCKPDSELDRLQARNSTRTQELGSEDSEMLKISRPCSAQYLMSTVPISNCGMLPSTASQLSVFVQRHSWGNLHGNDVVTSQGSVGSSLRLLDVVLNKRDTITDTRSKDASVFLLYLHITKEQPKTRYCSPGKLCPSTEHAPAFPPPNTSSRQEPFDGFI